MDARDEFQARYNNVRTVLSGLQKYTCEGARRSAAARSFLQKRARDVPPLVVRHREIGTYLYVLHNGRPHSIIFSIHTVEIRCSRILSVFFFLFYRPIRFLTAEDVEHSPVLVGRRLAARHLPASALVSVTRRNELPDGY